jgi:DNA-binding CsgD family transcriptional regulator/PAS domain-containing protein
MTAVDDFSRVVAAIYDAAVEPANWPVALDAICSAVGARGCSLVMSDRERSEITVETVGANTARVLMYNDYLSRLDPIASALARTPARTVAKHHQIVTGDYAAGGEFYGDSAYPSERGDGIGAVVTRHTDRASSLAVATARPEPFGTSERVTFIRALVPHLRQAIRTQARLLELDRRRRDFVAALDVSSDGIAVVGSDGRVIHLNPAAEAIVASADGLSLRSGCLRATVARSESVLDLVVHRAFSRGRSTVATGGCVSVPRPSGRRPYVVRVVPLNTEMAAGDASPTVLFVIADPEREPEPEPDALRRLYGLTTAEALVALRVLRGTGLKPIADDMSLSLATVRTHLQHVFDKTDTHRQAELVRLLLGGLPATRRPGRPSPNPESSLARAVLA